MSWRLTPSRLRSVSTIAPIMATSRTRPAAWKKIEVLRVEQRPSAVGVGTLVGGAGRRRRARGRAPASIAQVPTTSTSSIRKITPDQRADRQVLQEALAQLGEIDVEHHHDEQEQHRDRADIDDDQDHRQELGAEQQEQPGRVEEGEDQEQHRMHRVARAITMNAEAMVTAENR